MRFSLVLTGIAHGNIVASSAPTKAMTDNPVNAIAKQNLGPIIFEDRGLERGFSSGLAISSGKNKEDMVRERLKRFELLHKE